MQKGLQIVNGSQLIERTLQILETLVNDNVPIKPYGELNWKVYRRVSRKLHIYNATLLSAECMFTALKV